MQLEISESIVLASESAASTLGSLSELGVSIAIDAFGTGYAAFAQIQELPFNIVKIDKSFVQSIETGSVSEAIVRSIVNMARVLDFLVVAEGVEPKAELEIIRDTGCNAVQGYYLCKPLPSEELESAMSRIDGLV